MTQIGRILCAFCGGLIGYSITYAYCRFWDFIGRKRVEIPEIKYDVTDNPILSLKNRLGQAYVASYDRTAKKLLHRLLEYVEWIDNWHKEQVLIVENDRNGYKRKAERLQAEFEGECLKNAELIQQLKDAELKNEQLRQMLKLNIGEPLITPQDWQNTYGKKPIPVGYSGTAKTATEATELAERLQRIASQPIVMDSETLNCCNWERDENGVLQPSDIICEGKEIDEPPIYSEEFNKKLRDWWGLEADTNKWPDFMMKVNCVPKEWNRYRVTVQDKCGVTYTDYDWAPNPGYFINKFKESNYTVLSYDLDNPVYRGEESTT